MKNLIVALGLSLAFSATSVMADDNFQALNNLSDATITNLTNQQLEAVEGTSYYYPSYYTSYTSIDICGGCVNIAQFSQSNVNFGGSAYQSNSAGFSQSIN